MLEEVATPSSVRKHRKIVQSPKQRHGEQKQYGVSTSAGLACYGKSNLAAHLRTFSKRRQCGFCGKRRRTGLYQCRACKEVFCMEPPSKLEIPGSNSPRVFPKNGPFCFHRIHGFSRWADFE